MTQTKVDLFLAKFCFSKETKIGKVNRLLEQKIRDSDLPFTFSEYLRHLLDDVKTLASFKADSRVSGFQIRSESGLQGTTIC